MEFDDQEIFSLLATIWEAMLGLQIAPEAAGAIGNRPRSMAACVQITGAWNGAVLLDCPVAVAREAASVMFSTSQESVTVVDLQDAIAELVNMIGGNFKALLPETCFLSLPAVVEGGDYSARVPGSSLVSRVAFDSEGHSVSISILQKNALDEAAGQKTLGRPQSVHLN